MYAEKGTFAPIQDMETVRETQHIATSALLAESLPDIMHTV